MALLLESYCSAGELRHYDSLARSTSRLLAGKQALQAGIHWLSTFFGVKVK